MNTMNRNDGSRGKRIRDKRRINNYKYNIIYIIIYGVELRLLHSLVL